MLKAAVIAAVLFTTSIARADAGDPLGQTDVPPPTSSKTMTGGLTQGYLGVGALVGGVDNMLLHGFALEVGTQLTTHVWLHGLGIVGSTTEWYDNMWPEGGNSELVEMRVGVEARHCTTGCVYAGADVGFEHASFEATTNGLFGGPLTGADAAMNSFDVTGAVVVPRAGLELGHRVKFRPAIEVPVTTSGVVGFNATATIGTGW